jgi:hypothetical protein
LSPLLHGHSSATAAAEQQQSDDGVGMSTAPLAESALVPAVAVPLSPHAAAVIVAAWMRRWSACSVAHESCCFRLGYPMWPTPRATVPADSGSGANCGYGALDGILAPGILYASQCPCWSCCLSSAVFACGSIFFVLGCC